MQCRDSGRSSTTYQLALSGHKRSFGHCAVKRSLSVNFLLSRSRGKVCVKRLRAF
jgi:hypothetical protein